MIKKLEKELEKVLKLQLLDQLMQVNQFVKSSFKRDVAIVSEIAGTTRDVIETHLNIDGYPVVVSDTAGIRDSKNEIEKKGIKLALDKAENADLKLIVIDAKNVDFKGILKDLLDENAIL